MKTKRSIDPFDPRRWLRPAKLALALASVELDSARSSYPEMRSLHEGYAILLEEVDELWDEIKKKPSDTSILKVREEAIQVAAMALRIVVDLCQVKPSEFEE